MFGQCKRFLSKDLNVSIVDADREHLLGFVTSFSAAAIGRPGVTTERYPAMTQVYFVKLKKPEKALQLCLFADQYQRQGKRVLIRVDDENQGVTLDRFMWTWSKGAFLPHVYDNGAVDCLDEPVVIVSRDENPNGSEVLIMGYPCSQSFIRRFEVVIDFAEVYDATAADASRQRFAAYREAGFAPQMYQ